LSLEAVILGAATDPGGGAFMLATVTRPR